MAWKSACLHPPPPDHPPFPLPQNVHLYDASSGARQAVLPHGAPVLDATFESAAAVYSGGLDRAVTRTDVATAAASPLGSHAAAVSCVEWLPSLGLVASAGWDRALRLWDPRAAPGAAAVADIALPGKAYSMSPTADRLLVATSERHLQVYELRALRDAAPAPQQSRESSLKFQTRCVRCFPDGTGFAVSSVEGRVGMEYFDLDEAVQAKKYAFKCHRGRDDAGRDVVHPVNALAFNARHGTFVTGGCDGAVSFWDGANKKRLHQVSGYPTAVAAAAFSGDSAILAVAASYTYERGEADHPADAIYLRPVADAEIAPRQKRAAA